MRIGLSTRRNAGAAFLALAALAAVIPAAGAAGAAPRTTGPAASWRATEVYPVAVSLDSTAHTLKPGAFYGLSCLSTGNCVAGGWYERRTGASSLGQFRPMTATESHGTWGLSRRLWLPSTKLDPDAGAQVNAISCPSPGWCAAAGQIPAAGNREYAFVITESGGQWNRPHLVQLPSDAQQTPAISEIDGISCWAPRSCEAVGWYITKAPTSYVPIAMTESAGHWGRPTRLPLHLHPGPNLARLTSVSCPAPGWCAAVGTDTFGPASQYIASVATVLAGGRWSKPAVPSGGRQASLVSVGCRAAGDCVAVGGAVSTALEHGRWHAVAVGSVVPPDGRPVTSYWPDLTAVSCTKTACLAGGTYFSNTRDIFPAYVVSYAGGRWRDPVAIGLPGNASAGDDPPPYQTLDAVSCTTTCTAVGTYTTRTGLLPGWAAAGLG
jgi:hypothetical protein